MSPTWQQEDQVQKSIDALTALWNQISGGVSNDIASWGGTATSLGQKASAASVPVVVASDQSAMDVNIVSGSISVGAVTVNNGAGAAAVNIQDGGNSITVDASSLPLPTGAATSALQSAANAYLLSLDTKVVACNTGAIAGTVTANLGTIAGVATEATLSSLNSKVTACDTGAVTIAALPNEGQQTMANSISVAIASNQSTVPVFDSTNDIQLGVANGYLRNIETYTANIITCDTGSVNIANLPNEGQQTMANSISVAIASNQSAVPVSMASSPLPTGAATEATLSAVNTKLGNTGASAIQVQGAVTSGSAIFPSTQGLPVFFMDIFGNAVVPTGINAGGLNVLGVVPVDLALNIQTFRSTGEAYTLAAATANSVATARYLTVDSNGHLAVNNQTDNGKTITRVAIAQGAAGTTVLAAVSPGNKHKVIGGTFVIAAAGTMKLTDGSGDLTGAMSLSATGGLVWPTSNIPYVETAANSALSLVSVTGAVSGHIVILTEP